MPNDDDFNLDEFLTRFVEQAKSALGNDLQAIVLYGSAVEQRLRATSDVNIVIVLKRFDTARVDALREPFRLAHAEARLTAMFLLASEIPAAAEAFAVKFGDILSRHRMLFGDDPFAALTISRAATIRRLQQVLLNLTLRLRHDYMLSSLREEQAAFAVADATGPLRASAQTLLQLAGQKTASLKDALAALVASPGLTQFTSHLAQISTARETGLLRPGEAAPALARTIALAEALHGRAILLSAGA